MKYIKLDCEPWIIEKIANGINRDFVRIKVAYRESGVFYTKEMFNLEMDEAIGMTDYILISIVCWYKIDVIFETKLIINKLTSK